MEPYAQQPVAQALGLGRRRGMGVVRRCWKLGEDGAKLAAEAGALVAAPQVLVHPGDGGVIQLPVEVLREVRQHVAAGEPADVAVQVKHEASSPRPRGGAGPGAAGSSWRPG